MTLHIINKSPYDSASVRECLAILDQSDTVVLIENGVYAALNNSPTQLLLVNKCHRIFAIEDDVQARGLSTKISDDFQRIDYLGFVELCAENSPIQSWF